jgi:hypothetical protein
MEKIKPPYITTAAPGSFARYTLENRFPAIIDGVVKSRPPGSGAGALERLKKEIRGGVITDPFDNPPDSSFLPEEIAAWAEEINPYRGSFWTGLPFYFAEAYFYLRVLLACGYYDPESPYRAADPFGPVKEAELARVLSSREWAAFIEDFSALGRDTAVRDVPRESAEVYEKAVLFMLKGNRIDLSNEGIAERGRGMIHRRERNDLLVDHVDLLVEKIAESGRIDIVLDNAGSELVADLLFVWYFLRAVPKGRIVLHAKKAPIFVSDAVGKDVADTVRRLGGPGPSGPIGGDLAAFLQAGRLIIKEHHFWNGPKHFTCFPRDIASDLAESDLVLIKGDANYRRLLEDRKWPFDTNMADIASWFPGSFAVLRTLKCEVAADIPRERADRLYAEDPEWLTNGHWGIIRLVSAGG